MYRQQAVSRQGDQTLGTLSDRSCQPLDRYPLVMHSSTDTRRKHTSAMSIQPRMRVRVRVQGPRSQATDVPPMAAPAAAPMPPLPSPPTPTLGHGPHIAVQKVVQQRKDSDHNVAQFSVTIPPRPRPPNRQVNANTTTDGATTAYRRMHPRQRTWRRLTCHQSGPSWTAPAWRG